MKRFFCLLFVLCFLPLFSVAEPGILFSNRLLIDGIFYNTFYNASMDYDLVSFDFFLMDDYKSVYYQQSTWLDGAVRSTGFISGSAEKDGSEYRAVFENGEVFRFYIDDNEEDLWINYGTGFFRFKPCELWFSDKDYKAE